MAKSNGKPAGKSPQQQYLPTMEPPSIPEINRLADAFALAKAAKAEAMREEKAKGDLLWAKMREHKLTRYEYAGGVVTVEAKDHVRVKKLMPQEKKDRKARKKAEAAKAGE